MYEFESRSGHSIKPVFKPKTNFFETEAKNGVKKGVPFNQFHASIMAKRKQQYKAPKIIRNKSGDWYVQYYYKSPDIPGKWVPFKERKGINYIKDPKEKESAAADLVKDLESWLRAGNSPFDQVKEVKEQMRKKTAIAESRKDRRWTLATAINEFKQYLIKQNYRPRTVETYCNYLAPFEKYLTENNQLGLFASEVTEHFIIEMLDQIALNNSWSARTYNNSLEFFGTFFNRCYRLEKVKRRAIRYDFDLTDVELKKTTPQKNKAFTRKQLEAIKETATKFGFFNLLNYLEWILLSAMRPAEIRILKFRDIDEDNRQIRILGKTGDRLISDQLLTLIKKRGAMASLND